MTGLTFGRNAADDMNSPMSITADGATAANVLEGLGFVSGKRIERVTIINATPQRVHEILLDMAKYPDWNPMITSVTGTPKPWTAEVGGPITIWVKTPLGITTPLPCTVKSATPLTPTPTPEHYDLTWEGQFLYGVIVKGTHSFISERYVDETDKTVKTRFVHREVFTGAVTIPAGLVGGLVPSVGGIAGKPYEEFNEALKRRAETWKDERLIFSGEEEGPWG
ncbi:hypothetical protein HDU67_004193 [Dinochytrium kinnereticum]|nr:hypothetical protein HDU67_004193 [Dinochytrium kinnereticum]